MDNKGVGTRFECDVCGRLRSGGTHNCSHCSLVVCDKCWWSQAKVGHLAAEHGNEITFEELGYDPHTLVD